MVESRDRFVASSLERTKHPSTASRCCSKRGTLPEDRGGATEGRIQAHVQAVQGQSESAEKRYKDVVDRLRRSGAGVESDEEITVSDFPWFTAINNVMRDRAVTNPRNVIDSATPGPSRVETEAGDESEGDYDAGMMTPDPTPTRSRTLTSANSRSDSPTDRAASPTDRTLPTDMTDTPASRTTTPVDKTTTPADRTTAPPKKKRKKVSKIDKAERATNELVEKVLQQQAEERKKADELERERMKWEADKAKRESERDERFMDLLGHLVAMIRPPQPHPMQSVPPPIARNPPPMPRPVPSSLEDPYGSMYHFPQSHEEDDFD